jgi:hypothetical protein
VVVPKPELGTDTVVGLALIFPVAVFDKLSSDSPSVGTSAPFFPESEGLFMLLLQAHRKMTNHENRLKRFFVNIFELLN